MTSQLTIALDYDRTYDADPVLWDTFTTEAFRSGHKVILVTFRDDRYDKTPLLLDVEKMIEVFYTRGVAKRWWMDQFSPYKPDIWIDDNPLSILENSKYTSEELVEWRKGDRERHYPV